METTELTIDKQTIGYSNQLIFESRTLSFRKKLLFDLTSGIPEYIPKSTQGWWFGRKLLTPTRAAELIELKPLEIDVSHLQWFVQIELDECFNLEKKHTAQV